MGKISNIMTQQQRLALSAAQIQGLQMLTLQALQIEQRIEHEVEDNPALEQIKSSEDEEIDTTIDDYIKNENDDSAVSGFRYMNSNSRTDDKSLMFSRLTYDSKTLSQVLTEQLISINLDEKKEKVAEFIIGTLDDDGYLRRDNRTMSDDLIFTQGIDADPDEIEEVIKSIQTLDPAGVAARNLQECLLIQLSRLENENEDVTTATTILRDYYNAFVNRHYEQIISKLGITKENLRHSIEIITSLNPKPANGFSDDSIDSSQSITPDFFVDYDDPTEQFKITLPGDEVTNLRISKSYKKLAEDLKKENNSESKEAFDFITKKIKSAEWFISAIKQRRDTLFKTMSSIVSFQNDFFSTGDINTLHPMILKDIADSTGYDISTIWRVVDSKYVQTRFGIFPLKDFFSGGYMTVDGNEVSTKAIKNIIKTCIDEEDNSKPLTDQQIMDILKQKGYDVARRTIAKYREQLGLPVARLRKEI